MLIDFGMNGGVKKCSCTQNGRYWFRPECNRFKILIKYPMGLVPMPADRQMQPEQTRQLYFLINEFILWHLSRVRARFEGDLDCALILGEIGHFNVQKIISRHHTPNAVMHEALLKTQTVKRYSEVPDIGDLIKHCNALSISASTGIPRETVRRKIQWLEEQGWIEKNAKGHLSITPLPAEAFKEFNQEMLSEFFNTYQRIQAVLSPNSTAKSASSLYNLAKTED